jgi:hypothetical protein
MRKVIVTKWMVMGSTRLVETNDAVRRPLRVVESKLATTGAIVYTCAPAEN